MDVLLRPRFLVRKAMLMDRSAASQSDLPVPASKAARRTARQRLLRSIKIICIAYAIICLVLVLMETRLVFPGAYFDPQVGS